MGTFLFDRVIFGPVKSRRLGVSLGINLLPANRKVCNYNCIYCECGWSNNEKRGESCLPSREEVREKLASKLQDMKVKGEKPDVITFAGNGEPTLHPDFAGIIDDTIATRNAMFPGTAIAVLSNATTAANPSVRNALLKVERNILKLDSALDSTISFHNQPAIKLNAQHLIDTLISYRGKLIIQTLFLRGLYKGQTVDNTTEEEIAAWLKAIAEIKPMEVMIYTVARDTPEGSSLEKIETRVLHEISKKVEKLGIKTQVSD
jgi:wyosine [tRNA(Phe)-imidazoG37] synthetase (radical SAM superfamily)